MRLKIRKFTFSQVLKKDASLVEQLNKLVTKPTPDKSVKLRKKISVLIKECSSLRTSLIEKINKKNGQKYIEQVIVIELILEKWIANDRKLKELSMNINIQNILKNNTKKRRIASIFSRKRNMSDKESFVPTELFNLQKRNSNIMGRFTFRKRDFSEDDSRLIGKS